MFDFCDSFQGKQKLLKRMKHFDDTELIDSAWKQEEIDVATKKPVISDFCQDWLAQVLVKTWLP